MDDPNHSSQIESDHERTVAVSRDRDEPVSRRSMLRKSAAVGAVASAGGVSVLTQVAQASDVTVETWVDYFGDGDIDGWSGENMQVSDEAVYNEHSLRSDDGHGESVAGFPQWDDGPMLDLTEEFTVRGISRSDQGDGNVRTGFGVIDGEREGALLIFSGDFDATFLAIDGTEDFDESLDHYDTDFESEWVEWEIFSPGLDDGGEEVTVEAKVWEWGESEPDGYDLHRTFDPDPTLFRVWGGSTENGRVTWLDRVEITGVEYLDLAEGLDINVRRCLGYDHTVGFTVTYEDPDTGERSDVTDETTVESDTPEIVSVNNEDNTITTTGDESIAEQVRLTAEHPDIEGVAIEDVTVAPVELEHIDILPPWCRIQAAMTDANILTVLAATMAGVFGTRVASAFAGIGFATIIVAIGWFGGWIGSGLAMVSVFLTMFIGFNMAANIDYTMQR